MSSLLLSATSTSCFFIFALNNILSHTASQFPAHSFTLAAIFFIISLSPLIKLSVGSSISVFELYLIKSTKAPSFNGSSSHSFLTSVMLTILLLLCNPSAVLIGFATTIISVALKLVLGTPRSLTTLSKTPYGLSPCIVPATTLAKAPILIASYNAKASLLLISPTIRAESPILKVALIPSSAGTSAEPFVRAAATFIGCILYPNFLREEVGSSKVSSIVITLYRLISSISKDPNNDVFPALLVPATSIVLLPSIIKLRRPAAKGLIILLYINNGSVHGLSLCLLKAKDIPNGFNGCPTAATLAFAPFMLSSVSRIGLASSSGLPDISLNFVAHESASELVGIIFVLQSP